MLCPVACFSCGFPIGDVASEFRRIRAERTLAALAGSDTLPTQAILDESLEVDMTDVFLDLMVVFDCCRSTLASARDLRDSW